MIEAKTITHVVEHQSMVATNCPCNCPGKDEKLAGEFPADVRGYVQYGNSVTVLAALLSTYGAVAFNRFHLVMVKGQGTVIGFLSARVLNYRIIDNEE